MDKLGFVHLTKLAELSANYVNEMLSNNFASLIYFCTEWLKRSIYAQRENRGEWFVSRFVSNTLLPLF